MLMFNTIFPLTSLTNTCSHKLWAIIHSMFIEHLLYTTPGYKWCVHDKKISEQLLISRSLPQNKGDVRYLQRIPWLFIL